MSAPLERLLTRYERGEISRRDLLAALTVLVTSSRVSAAEPAVGPVRQLNHATMFVPDVDRAVGFYRDLFGMPILTRQGPGVNLDAGTGFVGIYPRRGDGAAAGTIDHLCLGLEGFDADAVLQRLSARGVQGNIRLRGDTKELYFEDPSGIRIQLQDTKYRGGVGPLGDQDP